MAVFEDKFIIGAFARKFMFSLFHVAFIFALIHFALNRVAGSPRGSYAGLPLGSLSSHLFDYAYFALMTLVSANAGAEPLAISAKVAVAANALTGVVFLVVLVTTYSMVTRERARKAVNDLVDLANGAASVLDRKLLGCLLNASASGALTEELAAEFAKVTQFKGLDTSEQQAYRGALTLSRINGELQRDNRIADLTLAQGVRSRMSDTPAYAGLQGACDAAGKEDAETVLAILRQLAADELASPPALT